MSAPKKYKTPPTHKICPRCKQDLPAIAFSAHPERSDHMRFYCKICNVAAQKEWTHQSGRSRPLSENKSCPLYLGVHIAERLLSTIFSNVVRMKNGTAGYDFTCGKGYKIDVKSSCIYMNGGKYPCWTYKPNKNKVADYFACLAFDNRASLTPLHFWLIPGCVLNNQTTLCIPETSLPKWKHYEKSLDKILLGCDLLKVVI